MHQCLFLCRILRNPRVRVHTHTPLLCNLMHARYFSDNRVNLKTPQHTSMRMLPVVGFFYVLFSKLGLSGRKDHRPLLDGPIGRRAQSPDVNVDVAEIPLAGIRMLAVPRIRLRRVHHLAELAKLTHCTHVFSVWWFNGDIL